MKNFYPVAALLDSNNKVIGEVYDAPQFGNSIEVAGCFTADGKAVNVKSYKISRSKVNLKKAECEQPLSLTATCYTFHAVSNGKVVY
jgi:hypothetical protein